MDIHLFRVFKNEERTLGILVFRGFSLHTLEEPWRDNARRISCIPTGSYRMTKGSSQLFPKHFRLYDVPDRSGILIHPGNTLEDTEGCILPGNRFGCHPVSGDPETVVESVLAFRRLWVKLPSEVTIIIK